MQYKAEEVFPYLTDTFPKGQNRSEGVPFTATGVLAPIQTCGGQIISGSNLSIKQVAANLGISANMLIGGTRSHLEMEQRRFEAKVCLKMRTWSEWRENGIVKKSAACFVAMNMMENKQDFLLQRALSDSNVVLKIGCPDEEQSPPKAGTATFGRDGGLTIHYGTWQS